MCFVCLSLCNSGQWDNRLVSEVLLVGQLGQGVCVGGGGGRGEVFGDK